MEIPANDRNRISTGQQVLINLRNYPTADYGQIKGTISYIADDPVQSGLFTLKVILNCNGLERPIAFKDWMTGDAEIITENMSLQSRILKSVVKEL